jgi:hypothetical protein
METGDIEDGTDLLLEWSIEDNSNSIFQYQHLRESNTVLGQKNVHGFILNY